VIGDGGVRELHIGPTLSLDTPAATCAALEQWFAPLVAADPAAWHLWPQMKEFEHSVSAVLDAGASPGPPNP